MVFQKILLATVMAVIMTVLAADKEALCPQGYFESGNGECARCHAGFWCDGQTEFRCSADSIAPREGMFTCQLCPTPRIADFPRLSCVLAFDPPDQCAPGMFVDLENTGVCVICPPGYECEGRNGGEKVKCGTNPDKKNKWYPELPQYTYADREGTTKCKECEIGTYTSTDGTTCLEMDQNPKEGCRKGYYHNTEIDTCRPCPIGYYCPGYDKLANPKQEKFWCDATERSYAPERKSIKCQLCGSNEKANTATRFNCIALPIDLGGDLPNEVANTAAGRSSMTLIILAVGTTIAYISFKIQKKRALAAMEAALI